MSGNATNIFEAMLVQWLTAIGKQGEEFFHHMGNSHIKSKFVTSSEG